MRRQPDFQVIGLGRAKAHVAGAQRQDAVRQTQLLQNGFSVARHLFQRLVALVGMRDLHHFDLVKLMLTDHAFGIFAIAARFGTEARAVGGEFDGQVGFG